MRCWSGGDFLTILVLPFDSIPNRLFLRRSMLNAGPAMAYVQRLMREILVPSMLRLAMSPC
jgi:hypothetical protein